MCSVFEHNVYKYTCSVFEHNVYKYTCSVFEHNVCKYMCSVLPDIRSASLPVLYCLCRVHQRAFEDPQSRVVREAEDLRGAAL